jgi:hypothetical protein
MMNLEVNTSLGAFGYISGYIRRKDRPTLAEP